ncbi:MAG: efflux RND transporter periplasmic adaptor subunit [Colwellia sp.]
MDISITKKKKLNIKKYFFIASVLLLVAFAINYLFVLGQADFTVDKNTVVYDQVKRGKFSVSVRGSGLLIPDNVQWLSAHVEARVERVVVKAGKLVKKGELIVELTNPKLEQLLEETQWELEARVAQAKADIVEKKSLLLVQKAIMLDAKLNYESSKLKKEAHNELIQKSNGAISKIDYEQTLLTTLQLKQRWEIQQDIFNTMTDNVKVQKAVQVARLNKMRKELERAKQQVNHLKVYATIDSVVQEVAVEPGQRVSMGGNIARLAKQDSLIAELQVPELQIRNVAIGQPVIIDTRNSKVPGFVTRVDPAVVNGNVQVDVEFANQLPTGARPDLAVEGEITITEMDDTLFVNRPLFAQSQSHSSLYKVSDDGQFAERIQVKLGKGSINKIQVLEGLGIGEKVIISDSSSWDTYQKIRLN